jgi:hypothetical protein
MHDKDAQRMREFKDVDDDDASVRSIRAAVLIVVGDRDVVRLDLTLVEQRRFGDGVVLLRYSVRR